MDLLRGDKTVSNMKKKNSLLLFEGFYPHNTIIYGIYKVAISAADIMNLTPVCLLPFRKITGSS